MDGKNVKVVSLVNGNVGVKLPNLNFKREWMTKGQVVTFPYDVLQEAMYDPGFQNMINAGVLYIEDLEAAKDLGLEDIEATSPVRYKKYSEIELKNLITKATVEEFEQALIELPTEQRQELKDWAITLRLRDQDKVDLLYKYFNFDIDRSIYIDKINQEQ